MILTLGANPAWQKVLFFSNLTVGEVNRADEKLDFPSGKGINFCRAAHCYGFGDTMLLQFAAGQNGQRIEAGLAAEQIAVRSFSGAAETRCCTTCIDRTGATVTELIEPSRPPEADAARRLLAEWSAQCRHADFAAICGTMPGGGDYDVYQQALAAAAAAGVPVLYDAAEHAGEILPQGRDIILKINCHELFKITGAREMRTALRQVFRNFPLRLAAITAGGGAAYLADGQHLWTYEFTPLADPVNVIGCGDTASAVMAAELCRHTDAPTAFRRALGAASANCLTALCGDFPRKRAEEFAEKIICKESDL